VITSVKYIAIIMVICWLQKLKSSVVGLLLKSCMGRATLVDDLLYYYCMEAKF
jgi:hypothetical protein